MRKNIHLINFLIILSGIYITTLSGATAPLLEVSGFPTCALSDENKNSHIDNSIEASAFLRQALEQKANDPQVYHLFSHGKPGQLLLNGKWSDAKEIATFLRQDITANTKEIYIYGCNFARGDIGKEAIIYLEQSLKVNIAASDNITGQNGDWVLENNSVDMTAVFAGYQYNLQDSDGDLVNDDVDLDDDNDGILDIDEGHFNLNIATGIDAFVVTADNGNLSGSNIGQNAIDATEAVRGTEGISFACSPQGQNWGCAPTWDPDNITFDDGWNQGATAIYVPNYDGQNTTYEDPDDGDANTTGFAGADNNPIFQYDGDNITFSININIPAAVANQDFVFEGTIWADESASLVINNVSFSVPSNNWWADPIPITINIPAANIISGVNTFSINLIDDTQTGSRAGVLMEGKLYTTIDTDNDNIANHLDLDSDNDGCPDYVEGGGSFLPANGTVAGGNLTDGNGGAVTTNLGNTVGTTAGVNAGVPTTAGTGQTIGQSQNDLDATACDIDTDGDGVLDAVDIDTDNDGIPDDVEMLTASNGGDTDGDGIPDHLDLDSDNDGIPDLIEAGGTDADGDGIVDDACNTAACDVDGDGLMDSADAVDDTANANPTTGVAGTTLPITDTDGDGNPDFQDLDSDNDGINDIEEAGITDTNNDGIVDDVNPDGTLSNDTDGDGFADSLDPNDNTTPGTGDGTGTPVVPADTDGDGYPDYQDLDSDNDGINDIVESGNGSADADGDGIADNPTTDADNDGIPDSVDDNVNTFGDAGGSAPQDTDSDNVPDYQDLDSDDDGVLDITESGNAAADPNGDGVADGGDTDGDGIPDTLDDNVNTYGDAGDAGVSDDTSDPLDENSGGSGTLVDSGTDADGDGIADSVDTDDVNFGLSPESCGSGTIEYAMTDGTQNTTGWQWDSGSSPASDVPSTAVFGTSRSTDYCESNGWRHYFNSNESDKFLFSIEMGSNTTEINYIDIRVAENPESRYDSTATNAMFTLSRDWHVRTVGDAALTAPVNIRFYYPPSELKKIFDDATALANSDGTATAPTPANIVWFKKDNFNPESDITPNGSTLTGGSGYTVLTPLVAANAMGNSQTDNSTLGNNTNYIQFNSITGFSGGSAFILLDGSSLPVELSHFEGKAKRGCNIDLRWVTESEIDFDYFELERSENGSNFTVIQTIEARGGGFNAFYHYEDKPTSKLNYYRLKMVDLDKSFSYSKVISVKTECSSVSDQLAVYPNPVVVNQGVVNLTFKPAQPDIQIQITDMLGIVVTRLALSVETGVRNNVQLDVSSLPIGSYTIHITGSKESRIFSIIE